MRYICSKANQTEVNAALRERFGETCTRTQILAYRDETGIDPRWIRKNPSCYLARALYRIPVGFDEPCEDVRQVSPAPKMAKREKVASGDRERVVIPSPFDDGAYDEPETDETPEPVKRTRKTKIDDPWAGRELDAAGEMPKPVMVHAWICNSYRDGCPGRKPGSFHGPDFSSPKCECGSEMTRHAWTRKTKVF